MSQPMEALAIANEVRIAGAKLKQQINAGETTVAEVLLSPPPAVLRMSLFHLLRAQRGWGSSRITRFCRGVPVGEYRRVGDLTERQRVLIAGRLDGSATWWEEAA